MWSRKFDKCINCGTTDIKHVAKGLCIKCYSKNIEAKHKKHPRHKRGIAHDFLTEERLIKLYIENGMSLSEIAEKAGCTRVNVYNKMNKAGITMRTKTEARTLALDKGKIKTSRIDDSGNEKVVVFQKIRYNENFFKKWSVSMAYVLGLIFTDGNLHIRKDRSGYELGILSFGQKYKELVEKFLDLMDCNATIRFRKRQELNNTIQGELYWFSIGNNELANDLLRLGVTPNKSLDMEFPKIPDRYFRHFVRGLFDGDGSVYLDRKCLRVKLLSGSKNFIIELNIAMVRNGFPKRKIDYSGTITDQKAFYICYSASKIVKEFYDFIYNGVASKIYYSRKREIFRQYFNID
jgi:predicted DNA-binding protein YlxM (UPF0122 family)